MITISTTPTPMLEEVDENRRTSIRYHPEPQILNLIQILILIQMLQLHKISTCI